jgi:hypothetical protein
MVQAVDFDNRSVERHIAEFDRKRPGPSAFDPLRYNIVYEQLLLPGDRVRVCNQLEPTLDQREPPGLYRESMPSYLTVIGVPNLVLGPAVDERKR